MPLDPSIFNMVGRGVPSIAELDAQAQAFQANKLAALMQQSQFDQQQRGIEDQNRLRGIYTSFGADPLANENALLRGGFQSQALALQKGRLEADKAARETIKTTAETGKINAETVDKAFGTFRNMLGTVTNPQQAVQFMQAAFADPVLAPIMSRFGTVEQATAIPQDPAGFQQWQTQASAGIEKVRDFAIREAAQKEQVRQFGVTSAETAANNRRVDERIRSEGAANRGVTMRGQNMTDARLRESTAAALTKPFEVTGPDGLPVLVQQDRQGNISPVRGYGPKSGSSKPLTEGQSKALLFGSRMREAEKVLDQVGNNYSPAAIASKNAAERTPLIGGVAGWAGNAMLSENSQKVEQAQRDFINAVLRRESGAVISDAEFDNARKQYFPQPGDSSGVLAQKKKNRNLATDGLLAEVPEGRRSSLSAPAESGSAFDDAAKERRYQEWKAKQK